MLVIYKPILVIKIHFTCAIYQNKAAGTSSCTTNCKKERVESKSNKWLVGVVQIPSHKHISLRTGERLPYVRMQSSTPRIINNYFDLLYDTLSSNNLLEKPCLIFNVDETGMPLDPPALKVVAPRGVKHSQVVSSGDKSQITVVGCCSAAGFAMPPMVVFYRMKLRPEHTEGQVEGTTYGLSKSGWIDTELFEIWFKNHFLAYAPALRPLLLILDGHSSHYQPSFIHSAAEEVIVFCLPPHTTHLTQPLDKGCFDPLKMFWREECLNFMASHPGQVVTRFNFSRLFSKAWSKAMTAGIQSYRDSPI